LYVLFKAYAKIIINKGVKIMNKKLLMVLMAIFVVLLLPSYGSAVEEAVETQDTAEIAETAETAETATPDQKTRLEEYKTKMTKRISDSDEKKIAGVCKNSQLKIEKVHTALSSVLVKRQEKLETIIQKLKALQLKVQETSIDTTPINNAITTLQGKSTELSAGIEEYQLILDDSSKIDCVTDPQGFKASLEAARAKRAEVKAISAEIKTYVTDSVKPVLNQVKTTLEQSAVESER
jgi:Tfp pilus assembly protein PilE